MEEKLEYEIILMNKDELLKNIIEIRKLNKNTLEILNCLNFHQKVTMEDFKKCNDMLFNLYVITEQMLIDINKRKI